MIGLRRPFLDGGASTCELLLLLLLLRLGVAVWVRSERYSWWQAVVVAEKIVFGHAELEVENIEEFSLDAAHISFSERSRAERPVDVLEGGVIQVLWCNDERP
jgi:hypothetical protein